VPAPFSTLHSNWATARVPAVLWAHAGSADDSRRRRRRAVDLPAIGAKVSLTAGWSRRAFVGISHGEQIMECSPWRSYCFPELTAA
jgi:hypothetical protein